MRLLASGQSVRFDPVFAGSSSFIFTGAIPTGISSTWTRGYNIYSANQSANLNKDPQAVIPGAFLGQNSSYSYSNAPMLALGLAVYPAHATAFLTANTTGSLRQSQDVKLFDTCRGQAKPFQVGIYNYYQGFHPMGYYSPPYGEVTTLSEAISDSIDKSDALSNGGCANLTPKEYNELRGIVSVNIFGSESLEPFNVGVSPIATKIGSIHAPYEECPPSLTKNFYFSELLFSYGAGSFAGGVAGNVYNHNPIPTSLDYLDLQLTSRYNIARNSDGIAVITGMGETSDFLNVANYGTGYVIGKEGLNNDLLLNNKLTYNALCDAPAMEGAMTAGINIGGTLDSLAYDPASPMNAGSLEPTFSHNPWHYWHFTYKENHDYLPFFNSQTSSVVPGINPRPTSKGTELFDPSYADSDYWWENRQCPETVDFLPWTFGATVYDCPRDYFEVPYYSAIRKFGYFGTRFLVTCNKLIRDISHDVDNEVIPIPVYEIDTPLAAPLVYERGSMDAGGSNTNFYFDNLLAIAQREQKYTEWAVSNRGYYLWANWELVENSPAYSALLLECPRFSSIFYSLKRSYSGILKSLSHHISGSDIDVKVDPISFREDYNEYNSSLSNITSFSHLDRISLDFSATCRREITGSLGLVNYNSLLSDFGFLIKSSATAINYGAYTSGVSGQEERIRTRYLNNISLGQPIDLFPTNHIVYSFDSRLSYEASPLWGRKAEGSISASTFGPNSLQLPEVPRRYFEGTFGKRAGLTGLMELYANYKIAHPNSLDDNPTAGSNFTLGSMFCNESCGKMGPKGLMISVLDGMMVDRTTLAASPIVNTWRALGYNEIGKLDGNFSCFTPILLQQPKNTFCKIGQSPTFRAHAVDYHTIPEDKIGVRHPEIYYWAHKLKLLSKTNRYLYPMKYTWGRVHVSYTGEYLKGDYSHSQISYAGVGASSAWGCLENNSGPNCTFIHPAECVAENGTTVGYNGPNRDNYSYIQGIKSADASSYFYFCIASGRYGIRGSDLLAVEADKFILTDIAFINGGGTVLNPTLSMKIDSTVSNGFLQDGTAISQSFSIQGSPILAAYHGLAQDAYTIPEEVMVRKKYIRNGGGQNIGFGFDGSDGFRGVLRSYEPETIEDTRGLKAMNHRPVDYGELLQYKLDLSDKIGGAVYGHSHLPVCSNYQMPIGRKGVRIEAQINGIAVKHKSITNPAEIGLTNPPSPMKQPPGYTYPVPNIDHVGQLYNINHEIKMGVSTSWQFHQNLGPVRRFGAYTRYEAMNSSVWGSDFVFVNDISAANQAMARYAFDYVQNTVVRPDTLAGPNCGYVEPSLGRKMLYFVEAFDRFYILCDAKAKYNVPNKGFIAPGLRQGDAPFQYAWIGQPSDTYLTRKSMYGPYAYQWKVMRHNRDRLGNGISQGFYSMGWGQKYSLMYDAAAIYGLYFKNDSNATRMATIDNIKIIRGLAFPHRSVRRMYLGRSEGPGEAYGYGDVRANCEFVSNQVGAIFNGGVVNTAGIDPNGYIARCAYYDISSTNLFDGGEYYCTKQGVRGGKCFDPCLSMRYSHGFLPGGKKLTNMSNMSSMSSAGGLSKYKVILTQDGKHDDFVASTAAGGLVTILRGPANTPYATALKNTTFAANNLATPFNSLATLRRTSRIDFSISPCEQGGADHCNYNTPTLHVGGNTTPAVLINGLTAANYNVFASL